MRRRIRYRRRRIRKEIFWIVIGALGSVFVTTRISIQAPPINFLAVFIFCVTIALFFWFGLIFYRFINGEIERLRDQDRYEGLRYAHQVDDMDPYEFERFAKYVLEKIEDCKNAVVTKRTGDGGIDINCERDRRTIVVQVKHYKISNTVGRPAVQQLVGAAHGKDECWFITTSTFTVSARLYAATIPHLRLIDRGEFGEMMQRLPQTWVSEFPVRR